MPDTESKPDHPCIVIPGIQGTGLENIYALPPAATWSTWEGVGQTLGDVDFDRLSLDGAVMSTNRGWAAKIRRERHIGNFTNWKDEGSFRKAFERLTRDLRPDETQGAMKLKDDNLSALLPARLHASLT